jgi:hypothetical protein
LAESAKTPQLALFAAKMLPNLPERANGLIVWDQPGNFQHFVQYLTSARDKQRRGRPAQQGWEQMPPSLRAESP